MLERRRKKAKAGQREKRNERKNTCKGHSGKQ
jgi:hypothetical protein